MDCSSIIRALIGAVCQVCSLCQGPVKHIIELDENLKSLQTSMRQLKDTKDDVRRTVEAREELRTSIVDGWLQRVDEMEKDVDEIIAEGSNDIRGRCLGGCCPKDCYASCKLGKKVVRIIGTVTDLRDEGKAFKIEPLAMPPAAVQHMLVVPTTGMDSVFDKVWNCITKEKIGIVGLYGMGGVGKSTLLKKIHSKFQQEGTCGFDVVIWVGVTSKVNKLRIQDDVAKRLGLHLPTDASLSESDRALSESDRALKLESVRALKLGFELSKKKFVLFLDDIWERVDLDAIGIPRPNVGENSRILFTTRSEFVCGKMEPQRKIRVECLEWQEAWKLFEDKVGKEALTSHRRIRAIAENVAKECAGLPLALITIGLAMSSKKLPEDWEYALSVLRRFANEFSGMDEQVYQILNFSYDALIDDRARSCFLYCSLFPDDHSIHIDQLIRYWIGEGFLDGFEDMKEAQFRGYSLVGILKEACLLESGLDSPTKHVRMHDVLRDLGLWIGREHGKEKDKFFVQAGLDLTEAPEVERWHGANRISLMNSNIQTLGDKVPTCPNLLTLIICENLKLNKISDDFFKCMEVLKVLDLSGTPIHDFPMSIVTLVTLQYLGLARTTIEELPLLMQNLVNLRCLDLSHTYRLVSIPYGIISSFSKLEVLDLTGSHFEDWEAEGCGGGASIVELECLKNLKYLSIVIKSAASLEKLLSSKKFRRCTIRLYVRGCHDLTSFSLSTTGENGCVPKLREVYIENCKELQDLSWLYGAKALESLSVTRCYPLKVICDGPTDGSFPNLYKVDIRKCYPLKDLSWLRGAPKLELLDVHDCEGLEVICNGVTDGCFPDLRKVCISKCDSLKDLSWFHGAPNLESLDVKDCKRLELICGGETVGAERKKMTFSCLKSLVLENLPELKGIHWPSFPSDIKPEVKNCPKAPSRISK